VDAILASMALKYAAEEVDTTDGVKIYVGKEWVHLRKAIQNLLFVSIPKAKTKRKANQFAEKIITEIKALIS
jgi:phosphomannomutase